MAGVTSQAARRLIVWNLVTLDGFFEGPRKWSLDWHNTRLVTSDAEAEVRRLKGEPGKDILVFGSAELCSMLLERGLVDELRLGVVPVVLGGGTPLFKPNPEELRMNLLEVRSVTTGCVILRYRPRASAGATAAADVGRA